MNHLLDMVKMTVADGDPVYLFIDHVEGEPVESVDFEIDGRYTNGMDADSGEFTENAKEVLREVPFYLIERSDMYRMYGTEDAVNKAIEENTITIRECKAEIERLLTVIAERERDTESLNTSKTKQNRFLG